MARLIVQLANRLPEGLGEPEVFSDIPDVARVIDEHGLGPWVKRFYDRVRAEVATDQGPWHMWEGFFDQYDDHTTLLIVGVLYRDGTFYSRIMRVRDVSPESMPAVEQALPTMITEYLEGLLDQLDWELGPGQGKHGT